MKYIFIILILATFSLIGCKEAALTPVTSDTPNDTTVVPAQTKHLKFPFGIGSYWVYNVYKCDAQGNIDPQIQDSIIQRVISIDTNKTLNKVIYKVELRSLTDSNITIKYHYSWVGDTLFEGENDWRHTIISSWLSQEKKWTIIYSQSDSSYFKESVNLKEVSLDFNDSIYKDVYQIDYQFDWFDSQNRHKDYYGFQDVYFSNDIGFFQLIECSTLHWVYNDLLNIQNYYLLLNLKRYNLNKN